MILHEINKLLLQRLPEIFNQIFGILDACRNANQRVGNAVLFADFLGHGGVGHYRGNLDETLHSAGTFCRGKGFIWGQFGTNLNYYLAHSEYAHGHCYSDLYLEPRLNTPYAYVIELKYCPKSSNEKDIDALLDEARIQLPKYINNNHLQTAANDKGWTLTGIIMVFNGWELTRYEVIEH